MQNNNIKKKNELFHSIMSNPKLSRTFKEAMSSPIGSTKREQAKSILSIMKKVGGVNTQDGKGGVQSTLASTPYTAPDFSNLMVFPALPNFKTTSSSATPAPSTTTPDWQKDLASVSSSWKPSTVETPAKSYASLGQISTPYTPKPLSSFGVNTPTKIDTTSMSDTTPQTNIKAPVVATDTKTGLDINNLPESVKNALNSGGTKTDTSNAPAVSGVSGESSSSSSTPVDTTYTPPTGGNADVAKAVAAGEGATAFAMDYADAKFGGGLDQYITNLDAKLKKDFNLEPLEQSLSDLKSEGTNLVPTLQNYIRGKDQYLKFIDSMIEQTENQATTKDLSDPADLNAYNRQLNYLYTLKGRQNTRYGNFLNSAVADYNADVTRAQSNYDNIYKDYSDALTRQGTMAQNEYNNLLTRMSSAYTELENAPTKAYNLALLKQQLYGNSSSVLGVSDGQITSNADYLKDIDTYSKQWLQPESATATDGGSLDMTRVGTEGLAGLYAQVAIEQGDMRALTETIRRGLVNTLKNSGNDPKVVKQVKGLIDDLTNSGYTESETWGTTLQNQLFGSISNSLSGFVLGKISTVKNAVNDLVNPHGGFLGIGKSASALTDTSTKEKWMKQYSALGTDFLNDLYNSINLTAKSYASLGQPANAIYSQLFKGTDQENADAIASTISNAPTS
jgi:hypothetical protein